MHNKTLTLSCRREPERVREIGGEGGIQYSVRKSGIVEVQVGHDTRVDRYFCGPLKDLTTFG